MDKKCACGLPLDEKTICSCQPDTCIYCCSCGEGCECGCQDNNFSEDEEA